MPLSYDGSERRKFKRLEVNFTVIYQVDKPVHVRMMVGNREVEALMLDLSEGGLSIQTNYNLLRATILAIKFTLINLAAPAANRVRKMEMLGDVRYNLALENKEHRLGICFTHINEEDKTTIREFIRLTSVTP